MNQRTKDRLASRIDSVRPVDPTFANASRLYECYQAALVSDVDVMKAVGMIRSSSSQINGVTEKLGVDHFARTLSMPETVALEIPSLHASEPPEAFIIVRFCSAEQSSREMFAQYLFEDVLCGKAVKYVSEDSERLLRAILNVGRVVCCDELVAQRHSLDVAVLLLTVYNKVVRGYLNTPNTSVLAKCLDGIQLGALASPDGNINVNRLAESAMLTRVGVIEQSRRIQRHDYIENATLTFSLRLGDFSRIVEMLTRWNSVQSSMEIHERTGIPLTK